MTTRAAVAGPRSAPGGNVIDINQALVPGDTGLVTRGTTLTEQVYVRLRKPKALREELKLNADRNAIAPAEP